MLDLLAELETLLQPGLIAAFIALWALWVVNGIWCAASHAPFHPLPRPSTPFHALPRPPMCPSCASQVLDWLPILPNLPVHLRCSTGCHRNGLYVLRGPPPGVCPHVVFAGNLPSPSTTLPRPSRYAIKPFHDEHERAMALKELKKEAEAQATYD